MDVEGAIKISKYLSAHFYGGRRHWRELLADVWMSLRAVHDHQDRGAITIARRRLCDVYRSENRPRGKVKVEYGVNSELLQSQLASRPEYISPLRIWQDAADQRKRAGLNIPERLFLYLWAVEGMSHEDIASAFLIHPNLVSFLIRKARAKLGNTSQVRLKRKRVDAHPLQG